MRYCEGERFLKRIPYYLDESSVQNERNYFVPLKAVKSLIRVPYITEDNQFIKVEIIRRAEELVNLEEVKLSDLVDFSHILVLQKVAFCDCLAP